MLKKIIPFIILFTLNANNSLSTESINLDTLKNECRSLTQKEDLLLWKENLEQQFSSIEVVGRAKTEAEEKESQKIKKILFHLKQILNAL